MMDKLHGLLYPVGFCVVIASLWVHAWSQSQAGEVSNAWYPPMQPSPVGQVDSSSHATASVEWDEAM